MPYKIVKRKVWVATKPKAKAKAKPKAKAKKSSTGGKGLAGFRNFVKAKTKVKTAKVKTLESALKKAKKEKAADRKKAIALYKKRK